MQRAEHYATARDGTRIHWTSAGSGPGPAVVLCDGLGCAGYIWRFLHPELARAHRVIHWNYRGHGRSERPTDPERVSIVECVDDLLTVLDDAGERAAVLLGHSMGVQVALEAHRRAPDRVAGLVLLCGAPGKPLDTFHDAPLLAAAFPYAREAVERFPAVARLLFRSVIPTDLTLKFAMAFEANSRQVAREDLARYLADLADVDSALFVRLAGSAGQHDASDHLPRVAVPTLIIAGEKDTFTPMWLSVKMHAAIPGSELLVLPGGTHVGPLEHPELCALRVEKFFRDHFPEPAAGEPA
ncbi:MAG: alpha/beta hydrolase, partial [Anaeromyxobacteraceae bacterium]|nr:alpha/beta hydrolase [Anaeromyxobacteraceae bacterium]